MLPVKTQMRESAEITNLIRRSIRERVLTANSRLLAGGSVNNVRLTKRSKRPTQIITHQKEQDIHVHVNGNLYSDVGVVAGENSVVNRTSVSKTGKRVCPNCGTELKEYDMFCSQCGAMISENRKFK